jgi:hypothetical protein
MHARGAVWCFAQGPTTGGGCARTWGGPTRARTRVARGGFDSADTHEAVELPAGVAALHTALAKVDRDNLTHFVFVWLTLTRIGCERLPDQSRFGVLANSSFISDETSDETS